MGSKIYLSSPTTPATNLSQDLYINNVNVGAVSYQTPIYVNLQDVATTPVTPISVSKPANVATVTLPTPAAAGVALRFPLPSQYTSFRTGDTGWRFQNGWYNYTPPTYPAKFAELDTLSGAGNWFKLKTALTVGGVTSTERFVDINGVQGWGLASNVFVAVIDKLTGLMFTRSQSGGVQWNAAIDNALTYSVVINGVTYDDWYLWSQSEFYATMGNLIYGGNWLDSNTGLTITTIPTGTANVFSADTNTNLGEAYAIRDTTATTSSNTSIPKTSSAQKLFYVRDARNLIS